MIAIVTLVLTILCGVASPSVAGELCLLPSAANGLNISVDCVYFLAFPNDWIGFRSGGGEACRSIGLQELCWAGNYGWTISGSATDPFENETALPLGTGQLYLWYYCTWWDVGLAGAEFDLGGTIAVHDFTPMNGFINAGDETHLLLSVGGCPPGPVMAGIIEVHDPVAVDAATWGRIKAQYR